MSASQQAAGPNIDSILRETRSFAPPAEFSKNAHIHSKEEYDKICARGCCRSGRPSGATSRSELHWFEPWTKVLEWDAPWAKWFVGGKINLSYNCLDRHVADLAQATRPPSSGKASPARSAPTPISSCSPKSCKFANVLKWLGVKSRAIASPSTWACVPELPIAMLACARIGAVHSVIFGGFSANALVDRITDQQAVAVITQDGSLSPRQRSQAEARGGRSAGPLSRR